MIPERVEEPRESVRVKKRKREPNLNEGVGIGNSGRMTLEERRKVRVRDE